MSDEAAFLEALQANPADDTARLVYADWLDEHDQPQKASYLRLVVDFAQRDGDLATVPGAERFAKLATALADDWRMAAGSRFALILTGWTDKIRSIKWIRELTGDGLGEAKAASENLPHTLFSNVPFETAFPAVARGREHAKSEVRITTGPPDAPPDDTRSDLVVRTHIFATGGARARAEREARAALIPVLAAGFGISAEEAAARAELNTDIVLATGLKVQEARTRRLALDPLIPTYESQNGWWLFVHRR